MRLFRQSPTVALLFCAFFCYRFFGKFSGLWLRGWRVVPTRALRCARIALDFRESLSVPVGICCDFTTIFDKNEPLFSPLWLGRKNFPVPTQRAREPFFQKDSQKIRRCSTFSTGAPLPRGSGFQACQADCFALVCKLQIGTAGFSRLRAPLL